MRLLVSVVDAGEASEAAAGGADRYVRDGKWLA